jgi:predicted transcriptional regulator
MTYTSYFRKSLKILSIIEDKGIFELDKMSLYDPEEIEMIVDVLFKLDFIIQNDKGFTISEKGKNVLKYYKKNYRSEKNILPKSLTN